MNAAGAWVAIGPGAPLPAWVDVYPFGWRESAPVLILYGDDWLAVAVWEQLDPHDAPRWRIVGRDGYTAEGVTHWSPLYLPDGKAPAL
jgi:hypothetical protein